MMRLDSGMYEHLLVGHDNQKSFTGILVCLELIVLGVDAGTTA